MTRKFSKSDVPQFCQLEKGWGHQSCPAVGHSMVEGGHPGCSTYLYAHLELGSSSSSRVALEARGRMRKASCSKDGLNRGAWTSQEDKLLSEYIMVHGLGKWRSLPANAGLNRCAKSCRLRWMNYLRPDIKRGNITEEEEELIIRLHRLLGNRWSLIAGRLPGRTDNEIKNYWNTYIRKKGLSSSSRKSKEVHPAEAAPEKLKESEVNVIRTKAVRCTKSLFTDQVPTSGVHDMSYSVPHTSVVDHETFLDLMVHAATPEGANLICSVENTEDSVFPGADDSTNTHSFHDSFSASASSNDFNYSSIYDGELEDADGLRPFVSDDAWISVLMPREI